MDALELVRRRARASHAQALGGARELPAGWRLVEARACQRGYDLIPLQPDDVLLAGAEAVLDRGIEAIFYNGQVEEDAAAALIAHELGHLELHEGTTACAADDVDASSSDEPTPAGVHRVESYSARERQELQANVYARELLLPRDTTRRLFLDEAQRASMIASRLRLPIDLVRQQLCESLLTPAPPAAPPEATGDGADVPASALSLDPSQRAAAEHTGSPLLLEAGPGTGKTRTLVARIVRLIESGVDPVSILALTFSNKAAREITDRVADVLPRQAPVIWTGTFHSFGLEILRKHHPRVSAEGEVRILDRSDAIELLEEMLPVLGLKHHQNLYEPALQLKEMLAAISRAKDEMTGPEEYQTLARAMQAAARDHEAQERAEKALEVAKVYDVYQRTLALKEAVDFGDLIMKPTLLLESSAAVRDAVRLRHRHVLVDEYQDVNRASARLLEAIAGDGERLWVVGDSRQSIYRFRGASGSNIALFAEDFPGAERMALGVNYRSSAEVVEALEGFARDMSVSRRGLPLELESHLGPAGSAPDLRVTADRPTEIAAVAARIRRLCELGVPLSEQAVLCRSNARVHAFSRGLEEHGVPVLHLGSLFERDEVRDMLSLLWLIADRRGGALMRVAAFESYAVPLEDVRVFLRAVRELEISALEALDRLDEIEGLSSAGALGLAVLARDLADVDPRETPWQILARYLFDRGSYLSRLLQSETRQTDSRMQCVALYQFLNFIRHARPGGRGYPPTRLLNKVRRLVLLAEERDLRQIPATALHLDAVKLMTIHGSKGLEFEAVHLPAMTTTGLPSNFRPPRCPPPAGMIEQADDAASAALDAEDLVRASHDAEEECLFFVALSRGKTHLHLYRSRRTGAVRRNPSIFLSRLRLGKAEPEKAEAFAPSTDDGLVPIVGEPPDTRPGRDLAAYEQCPRRYFYGRLFGLPGTWRDSAFVRTHRAIYGVLDWLKEQPPGDFPAAELVREQLDAAWKDAGPVKHAFEPHYRRLADTIVDHLIESHADLPLEQGEPLPIELPSGTVTVEPDLWAGLPDGKILLRVFRTGRKGSFRADDMIYGLYEAASRLRYGAGGSELEVLHLTDRRRTRVAMSVERIMSRCEKADRYLGDLAAGRFPTKPDQVRCPRCPYFFVCPTVPEGVFELKPDESEEAGS
ncbi:MAG: UvrD-helicase domain-containing protein [bacterium]|nr:UvrD-helicase domain-containing protein [bacterium]